MFRFELFGGYFVEVCGEEAFGWVSKEGYKLPFRVLEKQGGDFTSS
jgi:hypothetical protein